MNERRFVRRVAVLAASLGAVTAAVMWLLHGFRAALSVSLGVAVGVANLWALAKLIGMVLDQGTGTKKGAAGVLLGLKALALFALVGVLFLSGVVTMGSFVLGFTTVILSMTIAGMLNGGSEPSQRDGNSRGV